ncbi:hypothetical protein ILUMI_01798 [Ignelater luminosus]|uniref:Endonuclease/exonuclease/phosphatase domain-containing protein n=1 Tax=Ignelater luminosus TaxID=2038154 RepID=A0A8K0GJW6_IGNLU|nr:hypothetical protein ILUMI_01798 [Ignelater luminosus]
MDTDEIPDNNHGEVLTVDSLLKDYEIAAQSSMKPSSSKSLSDLKNVQRDIMQKVINLRSPNNSNNSSSITSNNNFLKKNKSKSIVRVGSSNNGSSTGIKGIPKYTWLHIGRIAKKSDGNYGSADEILAYLKEDGLNVKCFMIGTKGNFSNYKLGISEELDYETLHCTRGGGVIIAVQTHISANYVFSSKNAAFEDIWVRVDYNKIHLIIGNVYFPPRSQPEVYQTFIDSIELLRRKYSSAKFLIFGDFNLPEVIWFKDDSLMSPGANCSIAAQLLLEYIYYLELEQINCFNNVYGNILDLVFSEDSSNIDVMLADFPLSTVDVHHPALDVNVNIKADFDGLNLFYSSVDWSFIRSTGDMELGTKRYYDILFEGIQKFVSRKIIEIDKYPKCVMSYEGQQAYLQSLSISVDDSENDDDDKVQASEKNESADEWLPQPARVDEEVSDMEDVFADPNIRIDLDSEDEEAIHDIDDVDADEESASDEQVLRSKDNIVWKRQAPASRPILQHNIFPMCTIIIKETNRKAKSVYDKWNAEHLGKPKNTWRELTPEEFDGYLGILVTAGVRHSSSEREHELRKCYAYSLYRATLNITRFCEISRFIRFDNEKTRARPLEPVKAAAITDLWLMLNRNLQSH